MRVAVVAADDSSNAGVVDRFHDCPELNPRAVAAAALHQKIDKASVAAGDADLRAPPLIHPFVPKCQCTGPFRISSVVALHHSLDGPPQPVVFGAGETPVVKILRP